MFTWDPVAEAWTARGLEGIAVRGLDVIDGRLFAASDQGVFEETSRGGWVPLQGLEGKRAHVLRELDGRLFVGTDGFGMFTIPLSR